jgi:hypothetical protein
MGLTNTKAMGRYYNCFGKITGGELVILSADDLHGFLQQNEGCKVNINLRVDNDKAAAQSLSEYRDTILPAIAGWFSKRDGVTFTTEQADQVMRGYSPHIGATTELEEMDEKDIREHIAYCREWAKEMIGLKIR